MGNLDICPTCEIMLKNNTFYWSHGNYTKPATPDEVHSKVCVYAQQRNKPCINAQGTLDENLTWNAILNKKLPEAFNFTDLPEIKVQLDED